MSPSVRIPGAVVALAAAGALVACGGDDSGSELDAALGYLPEEAPFAMAISTDVEGEQYRTLGTLVERFPGGEQLMQSLQSSIEAEGPDFEQQVKPLLGNDFVVGAPDVEALNSDGDQFVGALPVNDTDALQQVIDDEGPSEVGEVDGSKLYQFDDETVVAVDDDVVVFADTQESVEAALVQSGEDDGLSEDAFDEALGDAPENALLRIYASMPALLESDPEAQQARQVQWVAALETLGLAVSAEDSGLAIEMNLATNPDGLTDDDLPIAAGADDPPPVVADADEIGIGVRDPSRLAVFAQVAAEQAGAGEIELAKSQISDRLGIDLDADVIDQLTGDAAVSITPSGEVAFRSELADPNEFEDTLRQLSRQLPQAAASFGAGGLRLEPSNAGGGLYELTVPDGDSLTVGVIGGVLAVAEDARQATRFAGAPPRDVEGAEGAVTMRADASALVASALAPFAPAIGDPQQFTEPLGELTGSLEAETSGLSGRLHLAVE